MTSIRKTLTRGISIAVSLVIVVILLAADIVVDGWVEKEFDLTMRNKLSVIKNLVQSQTTLDLFAIDTHSFTEFGASTQGEYLQIWYRDKPISMSPNLAHLDSPGIPYLNVKPNEVAIQDWTLPDGRVGKVIYTRFEGEFNLPNHALNNALSTERNKQQIDNLPSTQARNSTGISITLAYATSTEEHSYALWFIDGAFIAALILIPLIIHLAVKKAVRLAFSPIDELNHQLRRFRFSEGQPNHFFSSQTDELKPVVQSLNHFIEENYALYKREQRLTSDIAHELKTPITELINLAEVTLRFPDDNELSTTFNADVLRISSRMKNVVSNLMTINKYRHHELTCNDEIDIRQVIEDVFESKDATHVNVSVHTNTDTVLMSNAFAVESILDNLAANALQYRKPNTPISVKIEKSHSDLLSVTISNTPKSEMSQHDINCMFDPMWQKDDSRTSSENFGLGLTIVRTLSSAINANTTVYKENGQIHVNVLF